MNPKNSSEPVFTTDEDRSFFMVEFPIHPLFTGSDVSRTSSEKSSEKSSGKSDEEILKLLRNNPDMTIAELALKLELGTRAIEKQIRKLRESGKLERVGGRKKGYWRVSDG